MSRRRVVTEKGVNSYFGAGKRKYINSLGRKGLSNIQLETTCRDLFGSKFKGVYMQDDLLPHMMKPGYYIINTDINDGGGIHWIALVLTPKTAYVFDSFGRPTKSVLPILYKNLIKTHKVVDADYDQNQKGDSQVCGQLCIAFLICCKKFGVITAAKYI